MSLTKQTLGGLAWTLGDTVFLKGATFIAQLVLARLLGPKEFGLVGMMYVFIAIGLVLIDSGMTSSIVRTKNANNSDYSSVFYLNLFFSVIIYLAVFLFAPLIARFYQQPVLVSIVRIYCLSFIVSAFASVQIAILQKNMRFRILMLCNIPGNLIGIATGVVLGFKGFGVWSIVWMYLTTQVFQSIMLWIFSNWKPSFEFSLKTALTHFRFGYKLTLSALLNTIFENVYNVVIGKFYSVKTLGYYERAYLFNQYPVTALSSIITKVTYPILANIQDDKPRVANVYKKVLKITFFLSAPAMLGAAAIARPLFLLVLGPQWLPAVPYFQIICFASMFYPIQAFNLNVLKVYGRSDLFLKLEIIKKVTISLGVLIAIQFGVYALVWSSVVTSCIALFINTSYSSKMISYSIKQQMWDMIPTFLTAAFSAVLMVSISGSFTSLSTPTVVSITLTVGIASYFLMNHFLRTDSYCIVKNLTKAGKL